LTTSLTLLAGNVGSVPPLPVNRDGVGSQAFFLDTPTSIALDSTGNAYVNDFDGVRKITPQGAVSTILNASAADFSGAPAWVGLDGENNVYAAYVFSGLADLFILDGRAKIIKLSKDGKLTTLWSIGFPYARSIDDTPRFFAVDQRGNLFVAFSKASDLRVLKLSPEGVVLGEVLVAGMNSATDMLVDPSGQLVIADPGPFSLRTDPNTGAVVEAARPAVVRRVDPVSGDATTLATFATAYPVNYYGRMRLAQDKLGNVYATDPRRHVVYQIQPGGQVSVVVGQLDSANVVLGVLPGGLHSPQGIAVDANGLLYIGSSHAILTAKLR
jgi:sugar lactone lactonase YvrE